MELEIKPRLRRKFLARRNSLDGRQIYELSNVIQNQIIDCSEFSSASVIGSYFPINSEVMTQNIITASLGRKQVGLPRIEEDEIRFYEITQFDWIEQLRTGRYGLREPTKSKDISDSIRLLIVPGTVFDTKGHRLGYGKGYYDRFISRVRRSGVPLFAIGLAFDFQLMEGTSLPYTRLDERMDMIVTERKIINVMKSNP
jgi:5-formyltetrahydrofolate cyclo-ligase